MNIIPPVITNPFLYNRIIEGLQNDLSTLSWIDDLFPLAEVGELEVDGNRIQVPMVLKQDGTKNYINLFPDGNKRGQVFFELDTGDMVVDFVNEEQTITVNIVGTANLKKIANRVYDFTDELAATVLDAIRNGTYSSDILTARVIKDRTRVFEKYGYSFEQLKQLSYPYTGFKIQIEITVDASLDCTPAGGFDASYSSPC